MFGWTVDESNSFAVLDAFAAAGGNFIDTADTYSSWVPGHVGGESESIIGRWMAARGNRSSMVIATKVGMLPTLKGLAPSTIRTAVEGSLRRLGVDRIDLYYAHRDDPDIPMVDTLCAFDGLVKEGKVRHVGASNFTALRLREAIALSRSDGLVEYAALQPHYNLMHRQEFEGELQEVCVGAQVACLPYFSLAMGFLTGKYRPGSTVQSARAGGASKYLDERGIRALAALDDIAAAHRTAVSAVALAWLAAQPTVVAPIASARTAAQLTELLPMLGLTLTGEELRRLTSV